MILGRATNDVIGVAAPVDQIAKALRRRDRQAARKGVRLAVLGPIGHCPEYIQGPVCTALRTRLRVRSNRELEALLAHYLGEDFVDLSHVKGRHHADYPHLNQLGHVEVAERSARGCTSPAH